MLILVQGNCGSGKTLFLTMIGYYSTKRIVSNYNLFYPKSCHKNVVELDFDKFVKAEYDNCLIFLDELYAYLEARLSGNSINLLISYILFQSRKKNLTIYGTTQLLSSIDKRFRGLVDIFVYCQPLHNAFSYSFFVNRKFSSSINIPIEKAELFFDYFDTNQIISSLHMDKKLEYVTSNKDEMIQKIARDIIDEYPDKRITHQIVELYFQSNDLLPSLKNSVYAYIKLNEG
jgi:hypothetical protein